MSTIMFLLLIRKAATLQINNVLTMLGQRGEEVINLLYPFPYDASTQNQPQVPHPETESGHRLAVSENDLPPVIMDIPYHGRPLRVLEYNLRRLSKIAQTYHLTIEIEHEVGDMISDQHRLMRLRGHEKKLPDKTSLLRTVKLGPQRTIEQDPKYAIRLMVDVAIRALSPAINDPTTAVQALDQLNDLLRRLGTRDLDVGYVYGESGQLLVIYPTPDWDDLLILAVNEIRSYGAGSHQVMRRLRALLTDLLAFLPANRKVAVEYQIQRVDATIERSFPDPEDQKLASEADLQGISIVK